MEKLTKRQIELLQVIKKHIAEYGYPPTVREIGKELGLTSPATIQVHLNNLEAKNIISKGGTKNRALKLLVDNEYLEQDDKTVSVPLLGVVTAGSPIEAIEQPSEYFDLPASLIPRNQEIFTLTISGDSMVNAGIFDGDIVIVKRTKQARNGQKVVAMTNENEVTLKTYYKETDHIRLQPENDDMEPMLFDNVEILGIAVGLYRSI